MYIYQLPYPEKKELCNILDDNNIWEELGGMHMKFNSITLQGIRREICTGNSPTDKLLSLWGNQNHTVLELFILLSRMKHYQAMSILKKFVDNTYHRLIKDGNENLNRLLNELKIDNRMFCEKDQMIPGVNFNGCKKNSHLPKVIIPSKENNETVVVADHRGLLKPRSPLPLGRNTASDISCVIETAGSIPQIPYEELMKFTNNWSPSTVLGRGGFGTVFKGNLQCTPVAIKRIEQRVDKPECHSEQIKQSITELHCLNSYRHDNILPLYGYSIGGPHPCLVYQYMSGGSLDNRLRIKDISKVLSWPTRRNIAIGTARGLQFLHGIGTKPLIHGDIKPANILLDPSDIPKIGDFGLAREGPQRNQTHIKVSKIHGTRPYLPDEFLRGKKFSTKVDTFSFGVVLFEIATSLSADSVKRKHRFLRDHVLNYESDILELKDLRAEGHDECYRGLINVGLLCVHEQPKLRPEMVDVLIKLEEVPI